MKTVMNFVFASLRSIRRRFGKVLGSQLSALSSHQHGLKSLAVFTSGSESKLQRIHESCIDGSIRGRCIIVVTSNPDSPAAKFAKSQNIPVSLYPKHGTCNALDAGDLVKILKTDFKVDFILLAAYWRLLPSELVKAYPNSVLNIHPALLPSFGGKGYYGIKVHEAVLKSGVKFSGATVHFVNEDYDKGSILEQVVVPVFPNDTAQSLASRVLQKEHELYPYCISALCDGRIKWNNNHVPFIEH